MMQTLNGRGCAGQMRSHDSVQGHCIISVLCCIGQVQECNQADFCVYMSVWEQNQYLLAHREDRQVV